MPYLSEKVFIEVILGKSKFLLFLGAINIFNM